MEQTKPIRILLAKIGLDGHDRGVKVLARSFREAGFEVIYTGLWQTCETTMYAALQEDVDLVGVSLLPSSNLTVDSAQKRRTRPPLASLSARSVFRLKKYPGPPGNPSSTAAGGLGATMCSSSRSDPDASNRADSPGTSSTPAPSNR